MKTTFQETEYGVFLGFEPETPEEVSQCARLAINAKREPPGITMYFSDSPRLSVVLRKRQKENQRTTISNTK